TRVEVEEVGRAFRGAFAAVRTPALLTGGSGDAARLRQELSFDVKGPRWRYLHLASHGYFDEPPRPPSPPRFSRGFASFEDTRTERTYTRTPMLLSGLVLSGANADPDRGYLSAEEVSGLDLRGCELAVLSACETGLGKAAAGEGVLGLQRAFHIAGARSLV